MKKILILIEKILFALAYCSVLAIGVTYAISLPHSSHGGGDIPDSFGVALKIAIIASVAMMMITIMHYDWSRKTAGAIALVLTSFAMMLTVAVHWQFVLPVGLFGPLENVMAFYMLAFATCFALYMAFVLYFGKKPDFWIRVLSEN